MGHELEIDQNSNLYVIDGFNVLRLHPSPSWEQKRLPRGNEDSTALSGAIGSLYAPFQEPYDLVVQGEDLFFELSAGGATNDYRVRQLDLASGLIQDQKIALASYQKIKISTVFNHQISLLLSRESSWHFFPYLGNVSYGTPSELLVFKPIPFETSVFPNPQAQEIQISMYPNEQIVPYELRAASASLAYLSDTERHQIWVLTIDSDHSSAELKVLAGSGEPGYRDGKAMVAQFNTPTALSLDAAGNLYVADTGNHAIRKVTPEGVVTSFYKEL